MEDGTFIIFALFFFYNKASQKALYALIRKLRNESSVKVGVHLFLISQSNIRPARSTEEVFEIEILQSRSKLDKFS